MSIPASRIVTINPAVVSSGGNQLLLNGLFLTENLAMPTGKVINFASAAAVGAFFGSGSAEAVEAAIYFAGFTNSTLKPTGMLFAAFNLAARDGFLNGGSLAGLSLTQLQALSPGTVILTVGGVLETSASIDLSGATSFSNAAALILAGFTSPPFTVAWNPITSSFVFTTTAAGPSATVTFASGTLSTGLALTQATGAFLSQGAALDTPTSAMTNASNISQNWATFTTLFEPNLAAKEAFAVWANGQNNRYLYLAWDSDPNASVNGNTSCFGYLAKQALWNGVMALSGDPVLAVSKGTTLAATALNLATFVAGSVASIDFTRQNARRSLAFLQGGIAATVADDQLAQNLLANGYSFYGSYATANQGFIFLYNSQLPGEFLWADAFINQIYLNAQFQLALMTLLTNLNGSIPYNPSGYGLIRAALGDPISGALNFGSIRTGVVLSATQAAAVNQAAGLDVTSILQTQGFYLQILDPGAQARANRATPIINFWYTDGGAVQQITMASIDIL